MSNINRPFYRYGGHIELIGLKEYYGMPRGHQRDLIYLHQKAHINSEPVSPGHTIILLKSNQFNMATLSVKRSIFS